MKKKLIFLGIAASVIPMVSFAATAAKAPFYYGVWLPFWQGQNGAQNISQNLDRLDEVSPFSYTVGANGTLIDDLNIGNGSWDAWFAPVKQLGIKIIPTIAWFDTNGIYNMLSSTKARQTEEDRIAALVKTQNFSGIDIDFEAMSPATRPYYSLFIQGLAMRLHPNNQVLTCTVQARMDPKRIYAVVPPNLTYPENYTVLNQNCDEVRIMAYDQQTIDFPLNAQKGNGNLYAPVTDPDWVTSVLNQTIPYINPKKIMLGVPTYGYEYEVAWDAGVTTYQRVRAFDYLDAMDRAEQVNATPVRNSADELNFTFTSSTYIQEPAVLTGNVYSLTQPFTIGYPTTALAGTVGSSTTFFVTFPDSKSILDEINLAKKYKLRGILLFKADGDIDPMTWQYMN